MKARRKRGARAETAPSDGMRIDYVPLDEVARWPANPKRHDDAGIADSIDRFGYVAPLLLDETTGRIVAGHGRLDALQARQAAGGAPPGRVRVDARGRWCVPVVRGLSFASEAEADAYLIADNALSERGGWDHAALLARVRALAAGAGLRGTGYDDEAVRELAAKVAALTKPPPEEDPVPEPPAVAVSRRGDLWVLGAHRLLCGDSTVAEDVARIMAGERAATCITDPPYNVGKDYGDGTDDAKKQADYLAWTRRWFALARQVTEHSVVLTPGMVGFPMWIADIERTHLLIAWTKANNNSRNYIGKTSGFQCWEPILVYGRSHTTILRDWYDCPIGTQADAAGHPCPKPVKLWGALIADFTEPGDRIYEPFSGSGTTIIAAEQLGRRCSAVEIEPRYVDVAVRRWQNITGREATLDGDGRTFAEVAAERRQ